MRSSGEPVPPPLVSEFESDSFLSSSCLVLPPRFPRPWVAKTFLLSFAPVVGSSTYSSSSSDSSSSALSECSSLSASSCSALFLFAPFLAAVSFASTSSLSASSSPVFFFFAAIFAALSLASAAFFSASSCSFSSSPPSSEPFHSQPVRSRSSASALALASASSLAHAHRLPLQQ